MDLYPYIWKFSKTHALSAKDMCFYLDNVHLLNNMVDFLYDVTKQIRPKLAAYLEYQKKKRRS